MKAAVRIGLILSLFVLTMPAKLYAQNFAFQFYDHTFNLSVDNNFNIPFTDSVSQQSITQFYEKLNAGNYHQIIQTLSEYRKKHQLNDWFYYQLIRKTAEQISPKKANYERYTLYKWFLMVKSGYDVNLAISKKSLFFYVWSDEDIAEIPFYKSNGKQYVCLNVHDYISLGYNYKKNELVLVKINTLEPKNPFSYKVTQIPDFKPDNYKEKVLQFSYKQKDYHFQVKVNNDMQTIFKNYPGVNFESYFNIPLSNETYQSLIPVLKKNVEKMSQKKGVDYLMRFTRNAFLYENDDKNFGKEKRLSPELTLSYDYSDCDDRVSLFFYLVKEIYDLPMIAMLYPTHITMAVKFDQPTKRAIEYKGERYSVCEPTPQRKDLKIGQLSAHLRNENYEIVYQYSPKHKN